jgi:hypothetical protein
MTRHRPRDPALRALSLVLFTLFIGGWFAVPAARATPPSPQLDLRVETVGPAVPGRPVPFTIEVTPLVEGETIHVRVRPPADCTLIAGDTLLVVPASAKGETARFEYAVSIPAGVRRYVYVRAELFTASGRRIMRGRNLVLLAGPPLVPDVAPRIEPLGDGESGLVFDGVVVPTVGRPVGPTPPGIRR